MQSSKQFLIDRIVDQARLEGISLNEIEMRMLKFTEAALRPKDLEAAEIFEREYDDQEYEKKVANLLRHAYERDKQSDCKAAWEEALSRVAGRDLYLNVMIEQAGLGHDPLAIFKNWRFLLYGAFPPAFCLIAAIVVALSPWAARIVPSDLIRFLLAVCFLAAPWLLLRGRFRRKPTSP